MARALNRSAARVDGWLFHLMKLLSPAEGPIRHAAVEDHRKKLEVLWEAYEEAYYDTIKTTEDAEKAAAEEAHGERMARYLTFVDKVADLLRSTASEADSARDRYYSTSSQAGDDATVAPEQ